MHPEHNIGRKPASGRESLLSGCSRARQAIGLAAIPKGRQPVCWGSEAERQLLHHDVCRFPARIRKGSALAYISAPGNHLRLLRRRRCRCAAVARRIVPPRLRTDYYLLPPTRDDDGRERIPALGPLWCCCGINANPVEEPPNVESEDSEQLFTRFPLLE